MRATHAGDAEALGNVGRVSDLLEDLQPLALADHVDLGRVLREPMPCPRHVALVHAEHCMRMAHVHVGVCTEVTRQLMHDGLEREVLVRSGQNELQLAVLAVPINGKARGVRSTAAQCRRHLRQQVAELRL